MWTKSLIISRIASRNDRREMQLVCVERKAIQGRSDQVSGNFIVFLRNYIRARGEVRDAR